MYAIPYDKAYLSNASTLGAIFFFQEGNKTCGYEFLSAGSVEGSVSGGKMGTQTFRSEICSNCGR